MDLYATGVTYQTCLGVLKEKYPLEWGNCFGVLANNGKEYRIVNFVLENLEEAVKRGVAWPFKIRTIAECLAVIHDERIPDSWYKKGFCETCCPKRLLPVPQLLAHDRQIARGERIETERDIMIDTGKQPKL